MSQRRAPPPDPYAYESECKRTPPPKQWQNREYNKYIAPSNRYIRSTPPSSSNTSSQSRDYQPHNLNYNYNGNCNARAHRHQSHHNVDEKIGGFNDRDIVLHNNRSKWTQIQNRMRENLRTEDLFNWKVPEVVSIEYYNNNRGIVHIDLNAMRNQNIHHLSLRYIGAMDISSTQKDVFELDKACAGLFIFSYPNMRLVHQETKIVTLEGTFISICIRCTFIIAKTEPYIAGFLAFREVDHLKRLVDDLKRHKPKLIPDVILVDGHGILHYRRTGLATHLSMEINIPCVGIARNLLNVEEMNVDQVHWGLDKRLCQKGEFEKIFAPRSNDFLGYALRSTSEQDLIFVSPGNRISRESSLKLVMLCMDHNDRRGRFSLPMPIGKVRSRTRGIIRDYQEEHRPRCNVVSHGRLIEENKRLKYEKEIMEQQYKELQFLHDEMRKEYKRLKAKEIELGIGYEWWDYNKIVDWIGYLEHGRFKKYNASLLDGMRKEEIDATCLGRLGIDDLLRWGVENFKDRHTIMKEIRELLVKNSTTKGNDDEAQVEGSMINM
eukprot:283705_1